MDINCYITIEEFYYSINNKQGGKQYAECT